METLRSQILFTIEADLEAPQDIGATPRGERDVDPSSYYFRTTPAFETGSESYGWLNRIVTVGIGRLTASRLAYTAHEIL